MLFKYKGIQNGKSVSGTIEANNKKEAIVKLRAKNIFYKSLKESSVSIFEYIKLKRKEKIKTSILSNLSRDLSIYLDSGISIVNAIKLASNQYADNKKVSSFLSSIATFLDEGKSFANALELQRVYEIPPFFIHSINVSQESGILSEVLAELGRFLKEQDKITKQISSALAYPIFIIFVSIFMIAFMMVVVVPKITSIFEQMNEELPKITQFTIGVSHFLSSYYLHIIAVIAIIFIIFQLMLKFNSSFKYAFHFFILKIPFFGKNAELAELGRFSYMCSVLIKSGLPFVQAIKLSSNILKNSVISSLFQDAGKKVVEGEKLSSSLIKANYKIQKSFIQAIALGEETSQLGKILSNLSRLYFEETNDRMKIFLSLLEPMLMLFVGGAVGFIITSMLLPIFSLNIQ
jgi:general secretion pathway protein F/type IV pilus assembly protein PilC